MNSLLDVANPSKLAVTEQILYKLAIEFGRAGISNSLSYCNSDPEIDVSTTIR
jgi:hypothetical protein